MHNALTRALQTWGALGRFPIARAGLSVDNWMTCATPCRWAVPHTPADVERLSESLSSSRLLLTGVFLQFLSLNETGIVKTALGSPLVGKRSSKSKSRTRRSGGRLVGWLLWLFVTIWALGASGAALYYRSEARRSGLQARDLNLENEILRRSMEDN
jgi:hypothetical protein